MFNYGGGGVVRLKALFCQNRWNMDELDEDFVEGTTFLHYFQIINPFLNNLNWRRKKFPFLGINISPDNAIYY